MDDTGSLREQVSGIGNRDSGVVRGGSEGASWVGAEIVGERDTEAWATPA